MAGPYFCTLGPMAARGSASMEAPHLFARTVQVLYSATVILEFD